MHSQDAQKLTTVWAMAMPSQAAATTAVNVLKLPSLVIVIANKLECQKPYTERNKTKALMCTLATTVLLGKRETRAQISEFVVFCVCVVGLSCCRV